MIEQSLLVQSSRLREAKRDNDRLSRRNELLRKMLEGLREATAKPTRSSGKKSA